MFDYLKLLVAYFQEHWILAVNSAATLIALVACGARMHMMWKQRDIIEANTELAFNIKLPWFWPNIIDMFSATILIVFLNLSLLFAFLLGRYSSVLVQTINKPVFLIFWLSFAVSVYWLRGVSPFFYGLGQVFLGATAIFYALLPLDQDLHTKLLSLAGGIYGVAGGLDNIDKGLPDEYRTRWDRYFPKRGKSPS